MSRRLRATAAGDGRQVLRKNGSANKLLRGRGLGVARAAAGASPEEPSGLESAEAAGAAGVASSSAALGSRALPAGGGVSRAPSAYTDARAFCNFAQSIHAVSRMRAAEHAPRGPSCVLERRHGLAQIVERSSSSLWRRAGSSS